LRQHHNLIGQAALELDRAENRIIFNRSALNSFACVNSSCRRA